MDGYEKLGMVWFAADPRKATARYLPVRTPTTQLLYQGTGMSENFSSVLEKAAQMTILIKRSVVTFLSKFHN